MIEPAPRSVSEIASYHAHIYYDPDSTREVAEQLRQWIGERFVVRLGSWHDGKVGPRDRAMFQVSFAKDVFSSRVPWLMLNHRGLSILIHPNTTNPRQDHLTVGEPLLVHGDIGLESTVPPLGARGLGQDRAGPRTSAWLTRPGDDNGEVATAVSLAKIGWAELGGCGPTQGNRRP